MRSQGVKSLEVVWTIRLGDEPTLTVALWQHGEALALAVSTFPLIAYTLSPANGGRHIADAAKATAAPIEALPPSNPQGTPAAASDAALTIAPSASASVASAAYSELVESGNRTRIVESQLAELRNPAFMQFLQLSAQSSSFYPDKNGHLAACRESIPALAVGIVNLLETGVSGPVPIPSVRTLILAHGHAGVTTRCLVIDPEKAISETIESLAMPYWLDYLLRDVGWRGNFTLYQSRSMHASEKLRNVDPDKSPPWPLHENVITQLLTLAVPTDITTDWTPAAFPHKLAELIQPHEAQREKGLQRPMDDENIQTLVADHAPFVNANEKSLILTTRQVCAKSIKVEPGKRLFCWFYTSPSQVGAERTLAHYAYSVLVWRWSEGGPEHPNKNDPSWVLVGEVAADSLASVKSASIYAFLEVDRDGRVWARVESDRREPMAILVKHHVDERATRVGVTSLEVTNVSHPRSLSIRGVNGALDWFLERVISDALIVNRTALRSKHRPHHDDVWGGEQMKQICKKILEGDSRLTKEDRAAYAELIPLTSVEFRAFLENCIQE